MFEDVAPDVLGAVRALARELRYRPRPAWLGRRVRIDAADEIDAAVRRAVPELPPEARLRTEARQAQLSLAKYGILDLCFEVEAIDAPPIGFRTLRALGLMDREAGEDVADLNGEVLGWLDECRRGPPLAKIFLEGPRPSDVIPGWMKRRGWDGSLVGEYLPRELRIIDACETNGAFVWLLKHFYL